MHHFHEVLDFIDRPANTNDYEIPQVQPKAVEPTQSVVELLKPQLSTATPPPPIEAIVEDLELEPELIEQQTSMPESIHDVAEEIENDTNKQYYLILNVTQVATVVKLKWNTAPSKNEFYSQS